MPVIVILDKICPHCGGNIWKAEKVSGKIYYRCNEIVKEGTRKSHERNKKNYVEKAAKWKEENKERVKENKRRYREENREKIAEYTKMYRERTIESIRTRCRNNKEHINELRRKNRTEASINLSDSYIKDILYSRISQEGMNIPMKDITQEQIDKYRQSLTTYRILRQQLKDAKSNIT